LTYSVRWLKSSTAGADVYFGGPDATLPINRIFKKVITSTNVEQSVPNASFAAVSPDNVFTATLSSSAGLTIVSGTKTVNLPFTGGSDLDW
jgi:hypothetical protein